ncbi:GDI interacting protein 3 [Nomia melanderi]|uniref:GDI interacting protein 3 n=1 Tax=Nomia melanderi TaxID=2448451 RepID=UPI0013044067|nr:UBX domain-containing protein 6 [Nomia melanderi]XP_031834985.1 UBX domain-containing protein 6 [Nomia melanderi]XP_031834986.1 UBX domain-containing protein 6 [Nomia melanderi]XP_031834987.1 UBX domain-containing protein 6 [Nomia melanderi]XP_031834988.1 UBX domain-containing protein 6 [Nomia melanderi]XP_031834989.1 UBX domain-containing protein 6 [Nomia melanderi]XP_031834991.1 UBX domain-containing protein 6 [Nomia melanderi]XP_031834992.1 UBX domain-containing protein 6 [Nomia meland
MTDKIKSFFQKKKVNAKFMNAGKGYKLTDSTSTTVSAPRVEPIKRVEPTAEAKTAGQAALARLEAKTNKITKFNTSYAAIKAQVKRELEEEKRAQQNTQHNNTQLHQESEDTVNDPTSLAVDNVYFRCPYLSDEILPRNEWKEKIREFLYDQLQGEEAGLTACLVIQNCNNKREKIESCIDTLGKYLENIINNPEVEKYRKIRMQNKIFQEKVRPIEGALDFLHAAGFRQMNLLHNDVEEDFLVWSPENYDIQNLTMLLEALKSAEPIPLELDRNLQILLPMQASKRNELPSNFFTMTPEEIKREQQLRTEAVERNQMLRTKAMRERDEKQRLRKYKYSLIRIQFPDNIILQGTFFVHEKFQVIFEFVNENLGNTEMSYNLRTLIDNSLAEASRDKTLLELELVPTALLIFVPKNNSQKQSDSVGYLKEELLNYIQPN